MGNEKELRSIPSKESELRSMSPKESELRSIINSNKSKSFHHENKRYWIGKKIKKQLKNKLEKESQSPKKEGGFIPLIPILAGLASAAAISGGVATTVAKAKEARLNEMKTRASELEAEKNNLEIDRLKK